LQFLGLAYRPEAGGQGGRDFNLNPRRWQQLAKLDVPQLAHWPELCREARRRAEEALRALPSLTGNLDAAIRRVAVADYGRLGQLRARAQRGASVADEIEWKLEEALSESLMHGIHDPRVRVDAIVACFLTSNQAATAVVAGQA
jgi:ATP-dependent helicase HepA